jgi:hypothetical protein
LGFAAPRQSASLPTFKLERARHHATRLQCLCNDASFL